MKKEIMLSVPLNSVNLSLYVVCRFGHQAKIVHFLGRNKPWHVPYKQQPFTEVPQWDSNRNLEKFVSLWWAEYYSHTEMQENESHELQDAELFEQLGLLAAAPCSTHVPHVSLQI